MLKSMTGFARVEAQGPWGSLAWELRSVNHRFLEVSMHLPEAFNALEGELRSRVGKALARGRVDVWLRYQPAAGSNLQLNTALAAELRGLLEELTDLWDLSDYSVSPLELLRWPGVVQSGNSESSELPATALRHFDEALAQLQETRIREGQALKDLVLQRLDAMRAQVVALRAVLPEIETILRERLRARLQELAQQVEPGRWEQELLFYLQRQDVAEELDRLDTHVEELARILQRSEPVGRRLDFLVQELNREANTLGSKAGDHRLTRAAVELKVLIEQIREQIQNVE
ncbi:MAG: YicC/YloC family endoribonuclease [Acidithiobacillus sp.]